MFSNLQESEKLRSFEEIPAKYRSLFVNYPCFNRVQSTVFDDLLYSSSSIVVTAPTGSGKTLLFELAIIKLLIDSPDPYNFKAVYIAPVKALCNERFKDWHPRFLTLGVNCVQRTGDSDDHLTLDDCHVILTTPEKWDALTRRWRDNVKIMQMIKLVMIDEVHLLRDTRRGPVLETIVCRMKTMVQALKSINPLRFIAVSATIFNIEDIASWLGSNGNKARFYRFGNEIRPVALKRIVKGYPQSKSPFLFDLQLSYKLKPILSQYSNGKPVLIFCSTRKGVVQTCKVLSEQLFFQFSELQLEQISLITSQLSETKLQEFVKFGIGYHHAGMTVEDRTLIQDVFMKGTLPILVATSTLAMGVNLPAHLVIIKSTHQYIAGRVDEYPESAVLQMVGRAGRPQFDTSATAVIMTKTELIGRYENLLDCKEVLESSLHLQLAEHLNSEIVLYTITDLGVAMDWLRSTFLYQRALKNPSFYDLTAPLGNLTKIEKNLETIVLREINALNLAGMAELNENGMDISPTANGRLMSHYYVNFHTFRLFSDIGEKETIQNLLTLLSNANELNEIQLRVSERRLLNQLNINKHQETIRFPLPGKINTRAMKIECLVQACLGCLVIQDPSLQQESLRIVNSLERITKCLVDYLACKNAYCTFISAVILAKCLHARLWENSAYMSRQLERIGATLSACLVACGKTTFQALEQSHPQELERILNRGPPFGNFIIDQVRYLPRYTLRIKVEREKLVSCRLVVTVEIANKDTLNLTSTTGSHHVVRIIIGDSNNQLLHQRKIPDSTLLAKEVEITVLLRSPLPKTAYVHLISEQWVGLDIYRDIMIDPMRVTLCGVNCYLPSKEKAGNKIDALPVPVDISDDVIDGCTLPQSQYWRNSSKKSNPCDGRKGSLQKKKIQKMEFPTAIFDDLEPENSEVDSHTMALEPSFPDVLPPAYQLSGVKRPTVSASQFSKTDIPLTIEDSPVTVGSGGMETWLKKSQYGIGRYIQSQKPVFNSKSVEVPFAPTDWCENIKSQGLRNYNCDINTPNTEGCVQDSAMLDGLENSVLTPNIENYSYSDGSVALGLPQLKNNNELKFKEQCTSIEDQNIEASFGNYIQNVATPYVSFSSNVENKSDHPNLPYSNVNDYHTLSDSQCGKIVVTDQKQNEYGRLSLKSKDHYVSNCHVPQGYERESSDSLELRFKLPNYSTLNNHKVKFNGQSQRMQLCTKSVSNLIHRPMIHNSFSSMGLASGNELYWNSTKKKAVMCNENETNDILIETIMTEPNCTRSVEEYTMDYNSDRNHSEVSSSAYSYNKFEKTTPSSLSRDDCYQKPSSNELEQRHNSGPGDVDESQVHTIAALIEDGSIERGKTEIIKPIEDIFSGGEKIDKMKSNICSFDIMPEDLMEPVQLKSIDMMNLGTPEIISKYDNHPQSNQINFNEYTGRVKGEGGRLKDFLKFLKESKSNLK